MEWILVAAAAAASVYALTKKKGTSSTAVKPTKPLIPPKTNKIDKKLDDLFKDLDFQDTLKKDTTKKDTTKKDTTKKAPDPLAVLGYCLLEPKKGDCPNILGVAHKMIMDCLKTPHSGPCPVVLGVAQGIVGLCQHHPKVGACPMVLGQLKAGAGVKPPAGDPNKALRKLIATCRKSTKMPKIGTEFLSGCGKILDDARKKGFLAANGAYTAKARVAGLIPAGETVGKPPAIAPPGGGWDVTGPGGQPSSGGGGGGGTSVVSGGITGGGKTLNKPGAMFGCGTGGYYDCD
jgi:hypothetical protein